MNIENFVPSLLALTLSPLLLGVVNRTKAVFGGRQGQPLLQVYFDLWRLLNKGAVYSRTTTWVFQLGPMVGLSAVITATLIVPFASFDGLFRFNGDLILLAYLLGLARLCTVLAALDTGSSFEGMGASREVMFSALAEPALLLGLATVARETNSLSLSDMHAGLLAMSNGPTAIMLILVTVALSIVFLAENSRIPVDDPNTHLELTMIHEVMVLDHSGPDFAFILYGASLKLWLLGSLIMGLVVPARTDWLLVDLCLSLVSMFTLGIVVGTIESTMARVRMVRVPELLIAAVTLSSLALVLEYGRIFS